MGTSTVSMGKSLHWSLFQPRNYNCMWLDRVRWKKRTNQRRWRASLWLCSPPKWRGIWLYNLPPATASQISSKELTERAVHSTARKSTRSNISQLRLRKWPSTFPFRYFTRTVSMGTSSITPCYDVERLETKTHVGLGSGESIEYIKHRVSLEGHPWLGCRPESDTWRPYSYGQTKQIGAWTMLVKWTRKDCCLRRKDSGLQGRDIQVVKLCKCGWRGPVSCLTNVWNGHHAGPCLVEWALTPMGHCNPEVEYANVIASTNHLEILCFVTRPPLAQLLKPTKSCSDFIYEAERSMYILRALTGQSRDSWLSVGGGGNVEKVIIWALNEVEITLGTEPSLVFRTNLESLGPNSRQTGLTKRACRSPTRLSDASANSRPVFNESTLKDAGDSFSWRLIKIELPHSLCPPIGQQ